MFYLIYVSTAARKMNGTDLRDILKTSRENNAVRGVTGLLLYKDGHFMQLLEGEEHVVRETYARILRDDRHRDVITLQEGTSKVRLFPGWAMAYRGAGDKAPAGVESYAPLEENEIAFTETALTAHSCRATELLHLFKEHV